MIANTGIDFALVGQVTRAKNARRIKKIRSLLGGMNVWRVQFVGDSTDQTYAKAMDFKVEGGKLVDLPFGIFPITPKAKD